MINSIKVLTHDRIGIIREYALHQLEQDSPPEALEQAVRLVHDKVIGEGASNTIAFIRDPHCLQTLFELLHSKDRKLAIAACKGIGSIQAPRALTKLNSIIHAGPGDLRPAAVFGLSTFAPSSTLPTLLWCLDDKDSLVVINACDVLTYIKEKRAVGKLKHLIHDPNRKIREAVELAIEDLAPKATTTSNR